MLIAIASAVIKQAAKRASLRVNDMVRLSVKRGPLSARGQPRLGAPEGAVLGPRTAFGYHVFAVNCSSLRPITARCEGNAALSASLDRAKFPLYGLHFFVLSDAHRHLGLQLDDTVETPACGVRTYAHIGRRERLPTNESTPRSLRIRLMYDQILHRTVHRRQAPLLIPFRIHSLGPYQVSGEHQLGVARSRLVTTLRRPSQLCDLVGASSSMRKAHCYTQSATIQSDDRRCRA
jgi:hypothetical protein